MANLKVSEQAYPTTRYTEAAAPSTPASGEVVIYAKTDGLMYGKDDAGTETAMAAAAGSMATDALWDAAGDIAQGTGANAAAKLTLGAAGLALVSNGTNLGYDAPNGATTAVVFATRTSGNVTISNTGSYGNVDTGIDLVIAATAGDLLEVSANFLSAADADQLVITASTIVSAAVVNNLSSGTSTELPIHSWSKYHTATTVVAQAGGTVAYIVQSGDISGGNVTVRLRALVGSGSVIINANASNPLKWWAKVTRL